MSILTLFTPSTSSINLETAFGTNVFQFSTVAVAVAMAEAAAKCLRMFVPLYSFFFKNSGFLIRIVSSST